MVSDRHQALFAQSETKKSNNPFSSLHFSRAVSHDMPSSAAALQVATVTKANLAGKIASRQNSLTFPWHEHNAQRHEGPQSQHALPTVLKIHPMTCTLFLGNLEPRNIPPNRSCCNTAHPFGSNDLDSPPKRRFSTRTHTHIFRFPRIHKWRHTQWKQQRRPQPTACETTVRNAVGLTTRCHLTNHDQGEQLTPSCHHDQKVERHCPS